MNSQDYSTQGVLSISRAVDVLNSQGRGKERTIDIVADYVAPNVSEKVVRTILSYTNYVNSVIWRK